MDNEKVRLLVWGDAVVSTGFSRVLHSIISNLGPELYDIYWLGVNYFGDPHNYPYKIYPAYLDGDIYGFGRLKYILAVAKPDIIFILNDIWVINDSLKALKELYENGETPPVVAYFPVDAKYHNPEWYANLNNVLPITYTKFGYDVARLAKPDADFGIIPHGLDHSIFKPLDMPKREIRKLLFKEAKDEYLDAFIVLNANRNQPRKRLDITMKAFALFAQNKPENVKLHMHCGIKDSHIDIRYMAKRLGIESRLVLSNRMNGPQQVPNDILNLIYNSADVGINTSLGEGWGLCMEENTPIWTDCGIRKISEIRPGDYVYTHTGKKQKVLNVFDNGIKDTVTVILRHKREIRCTPDHLFLTNHGWKKASELKRGDAVRYFKPVLKGQPPDIDLYNYATVFCDDFVVWPRDKTKQGIFSRFLSFSDPNFVEVLSHYLAFGHVEKNSVIFEFKNSKESSAISFMDTLRKFGFKPKMEYRKIGKRQIHFIVSFEHLIFSEFLTRFIGDNPDDFRIPEEFESYNLFEVFKSLVKILSKVAENKAFFYLGSPKLVSQLEEQMFGNDILISVKKWSDSCYEINVHTGFIGILEIKERFKDRVNKNVIRDQNGFYYAKVQEVIPSEKAHVYDLEVEEDHSYIANGFVVHNCNVEHAVTGAPQIVPAHSACEELFGDCGLLVPVSMDITLDTFMTEGGLVRPEDVAEKIELLYQNKALYDELSRKSIEKFSDHKLSWKYISGIWHKIFMDIIYGHQVSK